MLIMNLRLNTLTPEKAARLQALGYQLTAKPDTGLIAAIKYPRQPKEAA